MKICFIFGGRKGRGHGEGLWSIQFDGENTNEYEKLYEQWHDAEYLLEFCKIHLTDLQDKFGFEIDPAAATIELRCEAESLFRYLVDLAKNRMGEDNLQFAFRPLDNREINITELQLSKGLIKDRIIHSPKLRIYAVRIDRNTYVVTGGAIKLTHRMQGRVHTEEQYRRLQAVRDWLKREGIFYSEDLNELS